MTISRREQKLFGYLLFAVGFACMSILGFMIIEGYSLSVGDNRMNIAIGIILLAVESIIFMSAVRLHGLRKFKIVVLGGCVFMISVFIVATAQKMGSMSANTQAISQEREQILKQIEAHEFIAAARTRDGERLVGINHSTQGDSILSKAADELAVLDQLRKRLAELSYKEKPTTTGFFTQVFGSASTTQYEWYSQIVKSFIIELSGISLLSLSVYFFTFGGNDTKSYIPNTDIHILNTDVNTEIADTIPKLIPNTEHQNTGIESIPKQSQLTDNSINTAANTGINTDTDTEKQALSNTEIPELSNTEIYTDTDTEIPVLTNTGINTDTGISVLMPVSDTTETVLPIDLKRRYKHTLDKEYSKLTDSQRVLVERAVEHFKTTGEKITLENLRLALNANKNLLSGRVLNSVKEIINALPKIVTKQ